MTYEELSSELELLGLRHAVLLRTAGTPADACRMLLHLVDKHVLRAQPRTLAALRAVAEGLITVSIPKVTLQVVLHPADDWSPRSAATQMHAHVSYAHAIPLPDEAAVDYGVTLFPMDS